MLKFKCQINIKAQFKWFWILEFGIHLYLDFDI